MNHLQSILNAPIFSKYTKGGEFSQEVSYVLHMTPADVLTSKEYKEWMNSFHDKTQARGY